MNPEGVAMANFMQVGDRFVNIDLIVSMYISEVMIGSGKYCIVFVDMAGNKISVDAGDRDTAFENLLNIVMTANGPEVDVDDCLDVQFFTDILKPKKEGNC